MMMRKARVVAALVAFAVAFPMTLQAHGDEKHEAAAAQPAAAVPASTAALAQEHSRMERSTDHAEQRTFSALASNLHPATVHFPIALLILAALLELAGVLRSQWRNDRAVTMLAGAGAVGGLIAAGFGWFHTGAWFGGDQTMVWHRAIGSLLAPAAGLTAWLSAASHDNRRAVRICLIVLAGAVVLQGYLGGELAHGAGHLWRH